MNKSLKSVVRIFPWAGMIFFGFLYVKIFTQGIGSNYLDETFRDMSTQIEQLSDYIKLRREYENDKLAFEELGLISTDDFDGKYDPWINTQLGLIRFDSNGFIVAYCSVTHEYNDPECPPNL
ncbi:MAG: hypothetical protein V3U82_06620 [Robiginitomaculum sp.]